MMGEQASGCCRGSRRYALQFFLCVLMMGLAAPSGRAEEPQKKPAPVHYDPKDHRDPFVPLVRDGRVVGMSSLSSSTPTKPVLYGVVWDPGGKSLALINDVEAKVGDMVNGYEVMEIRKDTVVLSDGGEPVVLQISYDTPPKKPASGTTKGGEGP